MQLAAEKCYYSSNLETQRFLRNEGPLRGKRRSAVSQKRGDTESVKTGCVDIDVKYCLAKCASCAGLAMRCSLDHEQEVPT